MFQNETIIAQHIVKTSDIDVSYKTIIKFLHKYTKFLKSPFLNDKQKQNRAPWSCLEKICLGEINHMEINFSDLEFLLTWPR